MFEWLLVLAPLVFGFSTYQVFNVVHSGQQNEEQGIVQALPSLVSTYLVYLAYTLLIGFTYGWLILSFPYPILLAIVKYAGVAMMLVLAYLIWARPKVLAPENYLPINEEFVIRAVHPAIPLIVLMMYSVFIDVTKPVMLQTVAMSIGLVVLSLLTHVFWIIAGQVLDDDFFVEKTVRVLDRVMAAIYVLLAVMIVFL